jgi:succinoglycan biosynthesis transport protein ExoP
MEYEEERREIDLMDYWRVIVKRKNVLFVFAGTLIVLIGIYSFAVSPKYSPSATLLIEEDPSKMLNIEDEFGFMGYRGQMRDMIFLNTQLTLLKSISLAERVAREMDLVSRPEFGAGEELKTSVVGKIKNLITLRWLRPKKNPEDGEGIVYDPYMDIAESLQEGIDVSPIRDTKVVRISYTSKYPVLATEIVNTYAKEYINFYIEKKYLTTQQASDFLAERIVNLREEISLRQRELQRYQQEKEIDFLTETESAAHDAFADLRNALTQAQIDRYRAQSVYQELRNIDVESIPQSVTDPVIENIRNEYTNAKSEYDRKSKLYKETYPEMVQLQAKMDSLQQELRKVVDDAESEYKAALGQEYLLEQKLESQRTEVARMNSAAIHYNSLKTEVESMRKLLDSLEGMQNETRVSAQLKGLKTTSISLIDEARVPKDPVSPKKKMNLLLALVVGIVGGVGLCFVFEYLDNTIKGPDEIDRLTGIPSLGVIPYLPHEGEKKGKYGHYSIYRGPYPDKGRSESIEKSLPEIKEIELVNYLYPNSSLSEDYRTIRTSILLSQADNPPRNIAFSSSLPMEGKTVTVANMAVALSQLNKSVMVLDADLRRPRLHTIFKIKNGKGLSSYLTGKYSLDESVQKTHIENVWLMASGPVPPNPAELLESDKMKLLLDGIKKEIDFVLLDTPPVLAVVDSLIISALVDCMVLVVQPGKTARKPFLAAIEQLRQSKANIIGVVFNKSDVHTTQNYDKSSYYRNYYSHSSD